MLILIKKIVIAVVALCVVTYIACVIASLVIAAACMTVNMFLGI